ncbi:hypothetical protein TVAG_213570 [Trichomonas vaginalis G3]|uniref:Uncharacterized protein n=1 Tax=Trichomonas vaginalis (strain ATCC PRA-98 / G3) TaxID=412133 RepID=A2EYT9_TRIV3|nr:hypothetical protein TVAGG3_0254330 [Trichomonas vaginalis G3]EAY02158.1 hypothetical protein TVAG_213570 [Trichomonas vaginalis G3]KAI5554255.1 hypothetical protein TVAGG3_0254330 [Trichomonas vaginalis G3]|eukprot:XP_001330561.1 hypothetical protein [Trichomonas vaginalis G3]
MSQVPSDFFSDNFDFDEFYDPENIMDWAQDPFIETYDIENEQYVSQMLERKRSTFRKFGSKGESLPNNWEEKLYQLMFLPITYGIQRMTFPEIKIPSSNHCIMANSNDVCFPFDCEDWAKILSCDGTLNIYCSYNDTKQCKYFCKWLPIVVREITEYIYVKITQLLMENNQFEEKLESMYWWQIIKNRSAYIPNWGKNISCILIQPISECKNRIFPCPIVQSLLETIDQKPSDVVQINENETSLESDKISRIVKKCSNEPMV